MVSELPLPRAGSERRLPYSQAEWQLWEERKQWRREDRATDARQLPARLSCSARGALRLPDPCLQRQPVTLRGRARGAGVGAGLR